MTAIQAIRFGLMLIITFSFSTTAFASSCTKLIAGGHPNYPPFSWVSDNVFRGANNELVRLIGENLKIPITFVEVGPWKRVVHSAKAGDLDLVNGAYYTEERAKHFVFTSTTRKDPIVIITLNNQGFEFQKWPDLIGKHGAAVRGESYGEEFDLYRKKHLNVTAADDFSTLISLLQHGRVDYIISSLYPFKVQVEKRGLSDLFNILPHPVGFGQASIMISKNSPCRELLPEINLLIERFAGDGTLDRVQEESFLQWKELRKPGSS
ncbi:transporter substrate-binding domain-containing protein [Sneathiella sp. P13V-1]|uniref:substrate-binding periplasmic protein n=1 Tax=Sneathiella sp. P13V-1 TaxID=2697366 RepID=UPI00187B37F1|nr:transporter substrate-binding domain-containing protein [Sneathiella sp. P13V-1]MBE7636164.1 transporter substrate-binding domain-containing protein [Sneathiella sp. P13V-1]